MNLGCGYSRLIAQHEMGMTSLGDAASKMYWKYVACRFQSKKKKAIRHSYVHAVRVTCPYCWLCFILSSVSIRNRELPCMCPREASLISLHTHDRGNPLCNSNAVYLISSATAPCSIRGFENKFSWETAWQVMRTNKIKKKKSCYSIYGSWSPACTYVWI